MTPLFDLVLDKPLSDPWYRWLVFFTFAVHFAFVLLTLGTGVLGVAWFIRGKWGPPHWDKGWDKEALGPFFVYKSLAIVWGVAPLLLVQAHQSIPFFTAVNLTAPLWLLVILLLIGALLLLEALAERSEGRTRTWLVVGVVGLALLISVPGVFAAVVVTAENPEAWVPMRTAGMPLALFAHWGLRLLHVLGAAVLFTAVWQWMRTGPEQTEKRDHLRAWIVGSVAYQVVVGVALYASLPRGVPSLLVNLLLLTGITVAVWLAWRTYAAARRRREPSGAVLAVGVLAVVTPMLLARQVLQDAVFVPLETALEVRSEAWQARLAPYRDDAVATFEATLQVPYENGLTIYTRSCAFCHGAVANGAGQEAPNLAVPPEDLSALRTTRAELRRIVREGVPGTAMPRFGMYLQSELDQVFDFLEEAGLRRLPEGLVGAGFTLEDMKEADRVWKSRCAACHGEDGRGTELARGFIVPPPDLTRLSFRPARAYQVISRGYPGTLMRAWEETVPEGVRWALADRVEALYLRTQRGRGEDLGPAVGRAVPDPDRPKRTLPEPEVPTGGP